MKRAQDQLFFDAFDRNIVKAMELSQNLVIMGDLNDDLLNDNFRNLRVPTRGKALLDPIIVTDGLTAYDSGVLPNPNEISDHLATYIVLPHDYSVSSTYIRRVFDAFDRNIVKAMELSQN